MNDEERYYVATLQKTQERYQGIVNSMLQKLFFIQLTKKSSELNFCRPSKYKYRRSIQLTSDNSNPRLLEPRANSNQNRFSLDFRHTFTVILPSVTRSLDNSKLPLTRSNFCSPPDHFYIILPSITLTMF